jgi:hypothetical protein
VHHLVCSANYAQPRVGCASFSSVVDSAQSLWSTAVTDIIKSMPVWKMFGPHSHLWCCCYMSQVRHMLPQKDEAVLRRLHWLELGSSGLCCVDTPWCDCGDVHVTFVTQALQHSIPSCVTHATLNSALNRCWAYHADSWGRLCPKKPTQHSQLMPFKWSIGQTGQESVIKQRTASIDS